MSSSLNPRRMTMEDDRSTLPTPKRTPWNKGKLIGAKPPLLARHVWSIRTKLQIERRTRDLAMFNLAIGSKLRGCDVIAIRVEDIAPNGYALARATVRQRKTGRPVRFELSAARRRMDHGHRIGPAHLCHALAPPHEGDLDLPSHRNRPISRNRGR